MSHWTIYLILKLDALCDFFHTITVISGVISMLAGIGWFIWAMEDSDAPAAIKALKITVPTFMLFFLLFALTPSTKQAAAIYLIPKVINNESVQNISTNTLKILEEYTADLLKEMKEKADEKVNSNGGK